MTLLTFTPQLKYRLLAGIIPTILLLASIFFVLSASSKINTKNNNLKEAKTKQQAYNESVSLNQFVSENLTALERMSTALPDESMMVGVTQDFEAIIRQYDPAGLVKFSGQTPVKIGQNLVIPVNIIFRSTSGQINAVIQQLSTLPYLIQILSTDSQINGDLAQTNINLRLYVQEPFFRN